jgi:hypothetical protein
LWERNAEARRRICAKEALAMFRITAETYRAFTLAEVLILAAMNWEGSRVASEATSVNAIESKK